MANVTTKPEVSDLSLLSLLAARELERLDRSEPSEGEYLSALRKQLVAQLQLLM